MEQLLAVADLGREVLGEDGWKDIVPVSATDGFQVGTVADVLIGHMPLSPPLYPDGHLTDEPEAMMIAELIREAALEGVRDELPHSLAVVVDEIVPREGRPEDSPFLDVRVNLYVERPSQKAIIIGKGGARLREVGTSARKGDRGAAWRPDLPRPAREGRQGLAARPQAAREARLLSAYPLNSGVARAAPMEPAIGDFPDSDSKMEEPVREVGSTVSRPREDRAGGTGTPVRSEFCCPAHG